MKSEDVRYFENKIKVDEERLRLIKEGEKIYNKTRKKLKGEK